MLESDGSIFGNYGIETCDCVPEHKGVFYIANTLRALLDLLSTGNFGLAQGARNDFICNDAYTQEFFSKVWQLRGTDFWLGIDAFMKHEYMLEWFRYVEKKSL